MGIYRSMYLLLFFTKAQSRLFECKLLSTCTFVLIPFFVCLFCRETHDRVFRVPNVDTSVMCEDQKIERP